MRILSNGKKSTLKNYKEMIIAFMEPNCAALKFIDEKIKEQGEDMEVIADETQMIYLFNKINKEKK